MDTLFIPTENDFRRWMKEAVKELLDTNVVKPPPDSGVEEEMLLSRKEVAWMFHVSLVTLHSWTKKGLPHHKQGGRVYFIRSEVLAYLKQKKGNKAPFSENNLLK
jgi:hypothetical protein